MLPKNPQPPQRNCVYVGYQNLTSSPPSTEAVLAFEQYRQKALPKVYALLGKVKLSRDRERGTRKSLGLNRPFPSVSYRKLPVIAHIAFPRAVLGRSLVLLEVTTAFTCARLGVI